MILESPEPERRCDLCDHWRRTTGSPSYGVCRALVRQVPREELPSWIVNEAPAMKADEGRDCAAFSPL